MGKEYHPNLNLQAPPCYMHRSGLLSPLAQLASQQTAKLLTLCIWATEPLCIICSNFIRVLQQKKNLASSSLYGETSEKLQEMVGISVLEN